MKNKSLLIQSVISAGVRGLGAISVFLLTVTVTRTLGIAEAGIFFLGFGIASFLCVVARVGLDNSILRFVGSLKLTDDRLKINNVMHKALLLVFIGSGLLAGLVYLGADIISRYLFDKMALAESLRYLSPYILFFSLSSITAFGLQALSKTISSVLILNILVNILSVALLLLIPSLREYVPLLLSLSAGVTLLAALILWYSFVGVKTQRSKADTVYKWSEILKSCLPLWLVTAIGQLILWSGQFSLGIWSDTESVALFSAAQRTSMLTVFVLIAVNVIVAPKFARFYKQKDMKSLKRTAFASVRLVTLFATPVFVLMLVGAETILMLFGDKYSGAANFLRILAFGQFVNALTGSVGYLLSMSGHERDLRNAALLAGGTVILLSVILVPVYGGLGAAISVATAISLQNVLALTYVKKRLNINMLLAFSEWRYRNV
ncbi:oligosaccharide flippase family protein [Alteromonas sp. 5E99-2]|uniref:oligosaccharide flippase family protein n=1 Tax=Alteromonas sp. 5E99-2 TaxID=2817683 RepID=UPI001A994571|nr:oligosaccharide flippase family protein [Alteromonas sp. 5E99-2]MBO1254239.1 oligosaccharide flippase family protein [Alteromonas sp. 5E99-2]